MTGNDVTHALRGAARVVWLDDDPTGTQTIRDLPVLTSWTPEDVRWALAEGGPGFFVLTNTRSLAAPDAAARVREVVATCLDVAHGAGAALVFASRGDSTLRGHHPLETDVIVDVLAERGTEVAGVVLAPAFPDAGRVTLEGVHYVRTGGELQPVAETEFAADATFGYSSSDLAEWVREKSGDPAEAIEVTRVTTGMLRAHDQAPLEAAFTATSSGPARRRVLVIDAEVDADLRAAVLPLLRAERSGLRFVYHVGPAFVGARTGQEQSPPVPDETLAELVDPAAHGLVVVGSHVGRTTRQLERLAARRDLGHVELDVARALADPDDLVEDVVAATVGSLAQRPTVLSTSRRLVSGRDRDASLEIARAVSSALTEAVRRVVARRRPGYVVAKGGITSSEVASEALGIRRARVVGSLLPGLVSLWLAEGGPAARLPYVVFAGNVGDDEALADVVDRLEVHP